MMFAQYCRLESRAGGVFCTEREFIRECRKVTTKKGKSRAFRVERQSWLRAGLQLRLKARGEYIEVMGGRS